MHNRQAQMSALELIFGQVNGASFVGIDTVTVPVVRKTLTEARGANAVANPHYGRILKHGIGHNVMVFQNKKSNAYENMVERRLINEGKDPTSFQLSPRSWGQRIDGTPFVEHKDKLYLEVIFLKPGLSFYSLDGVRTDTEVLQGLTLDREEAMQGGLENKVVIRSFAFDSIKKVTIDGQTYTIDW